MGIPELKKISQSIRQTVITATTAAGSGHPTSCLSAVELTVALLFGGHFRADLRRPSNPNNDRLIFSKGHAAPLLYSLYAAAGVIPTAELRRLRKFGSRLEGHPMPAFPYTEFPTGSLGQGLSVGVGIALAAKLDRLPFRTYVLLGDSEMAEGSIWEALQLAAHRQLDNLIVIIDVSRLGQSGPTMLGHNVQQHAKRLAAFGWNAIMVDGHNLEAINRAYRESAKASVRPTAIIAKTIKGRGVSFLENKNGWHGRALTLKESQRALAELGKIDRAIKGQIARPRTARALAVTKKPIARMTYPLGEMVAPRRAFGNALVRLAPKYPNLIVLDGEVKNSTYTEDFAKKFPRRFIEAFIAEQDMVGAASGLATRGKIPVAATFSAFLTRAFDQLRMAQYSKAHLVFVGTHPGVHIGADGPSQMGLEDISMFRSMNGSSVLYPSDAVATEKLLEVAIRGSGIMYVRATRSKLPTLYRETTSFTLGGSHTLRRHPKDQATIVAAGVTLHEALKASDQLSKYNLHARVIDVYSIQPIDTAALRQAARQTKHLVVVEDHYRPGGISEAVRSALGPLAGTVTSLAVERLPHSGTPEQLLRYEKIDSQAIIAAVRKLVRG